MRVSFLFDLLVELKNMKTDHNKRNLLKYTVGTLAGAGIVSVSLPFIRSLNPAPHKTHPSIEIDISKLEPDQLFTVELHGQLVYVLKRSPEVISNLLLNNPELLDPQSLESEQPENTKNLLRSIQPDIFVAYARCTHLGCAVNHYPPDENTEMGESFKKGNWFCPCHGSTYDLAGRVFRNMPARHNLEIPEYEFIENTTLRVKAKIF